ncbi:MAG TPA: ATP-binding cassette domain-containing protein, partial [Pseudomonadales bacterium]|nr:ATP-binding cassette domain-containing protein [Pseudomonadales bacterium]
MTDLLRITQLHKHFGKTPVLQDINLSVAKGEVLGLAGESGSGKSTLALCVAGLHTYDSGEILCNGAPLLTQ